MKNDFFFYPFSGERARTNNNLTSPTDSRGAGSRGSEWKFGRSAVMIWGRKGCGEGRKKKVKNSTRFVPASVTAALLAAAVVDGEKRKRIIKKHFRRSRQSVYVYIHNLFITIYNPI